MATGTLKDVIEDRNLPYDVDEGGAVFYGPKIDVKMIDAIEREWRCTTIQFDFNLPERFDVSYISEEGSKERPFMVHRALLGSMERFFGVLVEHYAGAFPCGSRPSRPPSSRSPTGTSTTRKTLPAKCVPPACEVEVDAPK